MVKFWDITIPELSAETRKAYLYLPDSYEWDRERRYPVLYMFDGHNVFFDSHATYGKSWGMKEYLDRTGTQIIVAAVECSHDPDNGRLKEYSPYPFRDDKMGKIEGRGKETMEWLVHTFKPQIDRDYRTLPEREHTFIAGSSMGGLMSLYAVLAYNDVFSRAACLSPSVWTAPARIRELIKNAQIAPDTIVYMDYGAREMNFHPNMLTQYKSVTSQLLEKRVNLETRIVPGGNHCEASWERQIPFFMHTLLYEA